MRITGRFEGKKGLEQGEICWNVVSGLGLGGQTGMVQLFARVRSGRIHGSNARQLARQKCNDR